jgi:phosphorylcholine metabolism protein LicD
MATEFNISKQQAHRLYKTMKDLNDILLSHKILYWVTGGSLMGAIRHRGIIPWDDDGDICIMKKDVPKLRKLIPLFKKKGYSIEEGDEDDEDDKIKECRNKKNSCTWFLEPKSKHSLGVDIFVMERIGPLITYADPYWRTADNGGKKCYFLYKFVFPLIPVRFGNFWVMTPNNSIEHLNQCYGEDWNSHSQRLFDHREGKWIDSKKHRMSLNDYLTIPAPPSTCQEKPSKVVCNKRIISNKNVNDLTKFELKKIASIYKIKENISDANLRIAISKLK